MHAKDKVGEQDISDLVASRVGTAVHSAAEASWLYARDMGLANLGIPAKVADRIVVNPDKMDDPDAIYIHMENRATRREGKYTISGKYDFVYEGMVYDIKTTKTYNWIHGGNDKKYANQASIYRWLNPDLITADDCAIEFLFTDWSPLKQLADPKQYPPLRVMQRRIKMMSIAETADFVHDRVEELDRCMDLPQANLPKCTPDELWQQPAQWAFYKNPLSTARATKVFKGPTGRRDAQHHNAQLGGKGIIVERPSEPKFCLYCDARPICAQAAKFMNDGLLKL
jgi:hypothetical protein